MIGHSLGWLFSVKSSLIILIPEKSDYLYSLKILIFGKSDYTDYFVHGQGVISSRFRHTDNRAPLLQTAPPPLQHCPVDICAVFLVESNKS